MSRDFENEFGQDQERFRGRSRRRDAQAGAGYGADSDIVPPRRPRAVVPDKSGAGPERETPGDLQGSPAGRGAAPGYGKGRRTAGENGAEASVASRQPSVKGNGARAGLSGRVAPEGAGARTAAGTGRTAPEGAEARATVSGRAASEGAGARTAVSGRTAPEGAGARTAVSGRTASEGAEARAAGTGRTAPEGYRARVTGSAGLSPEEPKYRAAGGRVYPRPDSGGGEAKTGRTRDTAFRRSGGYPPSGRAGRETAAADPAGLQLQRRRRWIIAAIILEVVLLCGIWTARNIIKKYNMIQRPTDFDIGKESNENLSAQKIQSMKGYWTIALFGVDSRSEAVGRGNNADVIIICNINQDNGEIKLVSVFRDSYLNVDENGTYNKINQAYFSGGPKQAIKALNRNLDLQIDDFATFNWKAVADAINILGGVDVELSKAEFHYINAFITETVEATGVYSVHLKKAGMNHLDGVQAVAYARLRKMDTDFARTERQRKIIDLSFQKLKQADFSVVNNVMEVVFPQILSSITLDDVIPAAKNLTKYTIADTAGFPWARSDANMGRKGDCVIPQTLESNVIRLHQFLYGEENYQPSDMVKQISAKISADSGLYNEGKPIDKVGTDGGYIPKPTEAPKVTEAQEREDEEESESSPSETDESIIDGEYDWGLELETDEYGYPIDPPEGWHNGYPGGGPGTGAYPGQTNPYESSGAYPGGNRYPGGTTSPTDDGPYPGGTTSPTEGGRYPGGTTSPTEGGRYPGETTSPTDGGRYPGGTVSPGDEVTGPGVSPTRPITPTSPTSRTAEYPGGDTQPTEPAGPGSVIIGPGQ